MSELEHESRFERLPVPELYEAARVLVDAFTLSSELAEELRPQLWTIGEKVANQVIEPEKRNAIALLTGIIDWYWFSAPEQETPPGMVLLHYDDQETSTPAVDQRIPYMNRSISNVVQEFRLTGMQELEAAILRNFMGREPEINQAVQAIIKGSAEYALLKSFDDPRQKPEESPLNPFWRQVRERQIEDDVRKRHALDNGYSIAAHTQAGQDYRRLLHQLDQETMVNPQRPTSHNDAVLRARSYALPFIAAAYEERVGQHFDCVYYEEGTGLCVRGGNEDEGPELYEYSQIAAYDMAKQLGLTEKQLRFIPEMFLEYAIESIVDPRQTDTLASILEEAIVRATNHVYDILVSGIVPHFGSYPDVYGGHHSEVIALLRQPQGPIFDGKSIDSLQQRSRYEVADYDWHNTFRTMSNFSTEGELYLRSQTQHARVESYGPSNFRVPARLVGSHRREHDLPRDHESTDLVITMDAFRTNLEEVPVIPGYMLVSERHDMYDTSYGFVVDQEGDPYRDCHVVINAAKRKQLADYYRDTVSMPELADKVESHKRLTVKQLVDYIRDHSDYHLPHSLEGCRLDDEPLTTRTNYINAATGFSKFVVGGRLQTQCTGSAHFLRYSLSLAFGKGCAGVVVGHVLQSTSPIINGVQHAQTIFNHAGKQFILDATPPANINGTNYQPIPGGDYTKRRIGARALQLDRADHKDIAVVQPKEKKIITLEQEVDELISGLRGLLRVAFDLPNDDQLFNHLIKLPQHDPARHAYETLVRFRAGSTGIEGIKEASGYLEKLSAADKENRRKVGFDHYSPDFVESLRSTVWRLGFVIERRELFEENDLDY